MTDYEKSQSEIAYLKTRIAKLEYSLRAIIFMLDNEDLETGEELRKWSCVKQARQELEK